MTSEQLGIQELIDRGTKLNSKGFCIEHDDFPKWKNDVKLFAHKCLKKHTLFPDLMSELASEKLLYSPDEVMGILQSIAGDEQFSAAKKDVDMAKKPEAKIDKSKIFIVHGHDEAARDKVELFIHKQGLNPVILMEQPSGGKTIIEKLEEHTDVGFGIVLYTPCDKTAEGKNRARQNVVLEHGYLMGKLGRGRVCALVKGDVELPSDNSGVVYISMNTNNDWKVELVRELKKAGYDASADKI